MSEEMMPNVPSSKSPHLFYDSKRKSHYNLVWRSILPFLSWLPKLNRQVLLEDLLAGLTGAIIVLPQGVAYAMIAGLPPEYGLYAAIVPAIIAALFGSSYHLISGPTVAMSIVVFTTLNEHAPPGMANFVGSPEFIKLALTLTFWAGIFQLALGLARMGTLINFVSHSVVVGFTAGAAILIATSQLKHVFGVEIGISEGDSFVTTWIGLFHALPATNFYVFSIALLSLITVIVFKKYLPRWPGMLFAMIIGGVITLVLGAQDHHIKLVPSIPASLPPLSMPEFSVSVLRELADGALAIALLGLVEAVSIARSVATHSQQPINGNQEVIGQGLSNIIGAFFSSYASSGSFARTGVNYEAGARTPLAAIFAAVSLALIVLLVAPLTAYVPMPSMAGILLLVSYNLIDFHQIKTIVKASKSETAVLLVTFVATLFLELAFAIYVGVLLSFIVYLNQTSKPHLTSMVPDPEDPKRRLVEMKKKGLAEYPEVKIIRIDGSLFFGAVNYLTKALQEIQTPYLLLVCDGINFIDVAGVEMLVIEAKRRRNLGGGLYFVGLKARASEILFQRSYLKDITEEAVFISRTEAIKTIFRLQGKECQDLL